MNSLKYQSISRLKYDLVYRFNYKNSKELPRIEKISLSFNNKKYDFNSLVSSLVALELLSNQRGQLVKSKTQNVSLKLRKGDPIGSKVTLRKSSMFLFISNLLNVNRSGLPLVAKVHNSGFSLKIDNLMAFKKLENNYLFFKKLPPLGLVLHGVSKSSYEMLFVFKHLKFKEFH